MKSITYIFLIWVGITLCASCSSDKREAQGADSARPQWVERLDKVQPPVVYFKYNQLVNGYEVTAKWAPVNEKAEIGPVTMLFHNTQTGKEFAFSRYMYSSYDTDRLCSAKDFQGHQGGDIHYFNYTPPDSIDHFKEINGNSPLGYYTPFQFLDIDFDGQEELLVSDWYQGQAGNNYSVYKITNNGLDELVYMPLDDLTNVDRIDMKNKVITSVHFIGADDKAEFYFSHKQRKDQITNVPTFKSNCAKDFDFEKYNAQMGVPFALDSIKEYGVSSAQKYKVKYVVENDKIIRQ